MTHRRPGYALIAVLLVIVVLSLAAYRFADAMTAQYQVAVRNTEDAQVKAAANSGIAYAMGVLSDPSMVQGALGGYTDDNPSFFANQPIGPQDGGRMGLRFTLVHVADTYFSSGEGRYQPRYGVLDESSKLNINALITQDPTGDVLYDALMKLPYMTEDVADAIVDWVDPDDTQRPSGAESSYYSTLPEPYMVKNGPLSSVEELLLVRGVLPMLLFGNDRNRNGLLDPGEEDGLEFSRGWSEFLTVYGRELNIDSLGNPRVDLNDQTADPVLMSQQLTASLGQEMADYIMAAKFYGTQSIPTTSVTVMSTSGDRSSGSGSGTVVMRMTVVTTGNQDSQSSTVPGGPDELRAAVQNSIDTGAQLRNRISSVLTLHNTQVRLPLPPDAPPETPTVVVPCPLNDPTKLNDLLPLLLDATTTQTGYEMIPRVNINTAPPEVIEGLPGMTPENLDTILTVRQGLPPTDLATTTGAWLVTEANLPVSTFRSLERYITGKTMTYRVHSVGYFGEGGPTARVEAVIDTNLGHPRIVYYRDLTDLGRGFVLPR